LRDRTAVRGLDVSKSVSSYTAEMNLISQMYLGMGGRLIEYAVNILITLTAIALIDWRMALISLAAYVLPVFFTRAQQNKLTAAQKKFQAENDRHTDNFLQKLKGVEAIKNYHIEEKILSLFNSSLTKLVREDIRRAETRARTNGLSSALTYFSQAVIAGLSALFVFRGEISAGNFVSIFALSSAISGQIYWLARSVEGVISARPAVKSVLDYIDFPHRDSASSPAPPVRDSSLALQAEDVALSYGERQILDGLNLDVAKGEKVLILGTSGSGKSSLMSLIAGYHPPDRGEIRLADANRSDLITMVEQDPFIFSGTAEDNLFCEDTADATAQASSGNRELGGNAGENASCAADAAQIMRRLGLSALQEKEQGVAERGHNLSGGERKRLALARGFLRDSQILILDEPLANVDPENAEHIEDLILGLRNRTIILISHRVSERLLAGMDKVYILEGGRLRRSEPVACLSHPESDTLCEAGCV
ncbi:MAG: ABC transporter ATP-binding protein, partial [Clostridiaceae bacterium]|nr:ABC transporter ATP-binding protein [Clostridiaceae bacterium]